MPSHPSEPPVRLVRLDGPSGYLDVAIAADLPISALVGPLVDAVGAPPAGAWAIELVESQRLFAQLGPLRLDPALTLDQCGVVDGDGLRLVRIASSDPSGTAC